MHGHCRLIIGAPFILVPFCCMPLIYLVSQGVPKVTLLFCLMYLAFSGPVHYPSIIPFLFFSLSPSMRLFIACVSGPCRFLPVESIYGPITPAELSASAMSLRIHPASLPNPWKPWAFLLPVSCCVVFTVHPAVQRSMCDCE